MHTHKADIEPDHGLIEERLQRLQTIQEIFNKEKWLTAEMLHHLQAEPPSNQLLPASVSAKFWDFSGAISILRRGCSQSIDLQ